MTKSFDKLDSVRDQLVAFFKDKEFSRAFMLRYALGDEGLRLEVGTEPCTGGEELHVYITPFIKDATTVHIELLPDEAAELAVILWAFSEANRGTP